MQIRQSCPELADLAGQQTHIVVGDGMVRLGLQDGDIQVFRLFQVASLMRFQRQRQLGVELRFHGGVSVHKREEKCTSGNCNC
ncbi:hypothetical protein D3C72_1620920 [compost metagenome]